jgi:hypothetical protein
MPAIAKSPFTGKGVKAALMFLLFQKRVCGPLATPCSITGPAEAPEPASKVETACYKADYAIQQVPDLLSAA